MSDAPGLSDAFLDRYNEKFLTFQGESDPMPTAVGELGVGRRVFFSQGVHCRHPAGSGGFFVLGYGAIRLTPQGSSTAIIWPADA
jgi:hypothetical protein